MSDRKPIPSDVKRSLRQEAGFGCCKCGRPIIEYHHILPYTEDDPHFRIKDMMCLCPYCHHEATVGAMTMQEQRDLKSNPINIINDRAEGHLKVNQDLLMITLGNNQFLTENAIITVDGNNLIQVKSNENGRLDLSLKLYNEQNDLILEIKDNEWVSGDFIPWDIESSFQILKIRNKKYDIALDINAKEIPLMINGKIWHNQHLIKLTSKGIFFNAKKSSGQISDICFVGSNLELDTNEGVFSICPHPVYNGHSMIPGTIERKIKEGTEAFNRLKKNYIQQNL
ncbi:MAG: hypothetical protein HWE21_15235 [Cytophagia bacterium]|nr:hypothetical protein [Cytophagia bacterium]